MARTIYINTDSGSIETAPVAGINRPSARVPLQSIVGGTSETYNLYFVKNDGTYDSRSGSGSVTINVAIGPQGETAKTGNFTVTDDSGASEEIPAGASAQVLEDILNEMNTNTGPQAGLVDVKKLGDGLWLVTWRAVGARSVLTGTSVNLNPESVVTPAILITGDASTRCQQIIQVNRQPAIFQDTWSTITDGFSGTIDADVTRIVQALGAEKSIETVFEVRIDDDVVCAAPIRLLAPVGGAASVSGAEPYSGSLASDPANYPGFDGSAWRQALDVDTYGQFYFSSASATTISVSGTYYKAAGTTTSSQLSNVTMPANNRLQNDSGATRVFRITAHVDATDGAGNKLVGMKLAKNGTAIDETLVNDETASNTGANLDINWFVSLANGEYVEIFLANLTDTSDVTAANGQMLIQAVD